MNIPKVVNMYMGDEKYGVFGNKHNLLPKMSYQCLNQTHNPPDSPHHLSSC